MLLPLTVGSGRPGSAVVIEVARHRLSRVVMFLYVRYCKRTPQGKIDLGLAYMLVNAAGDRPAQHVGHQRPDD